MIVWQPGILEPCGSSADAEKAKNGNHKIRDRSAAAETGAAFRADYSVYG